MHRVAFRSLIVLLAVILLNGPSAHAQRRPRKPVRGVQIQAAQGPCLPEDEPCGGGGGTGSVTVTPDDGQETVYLGSTNNVAEFVIINNYSSSYTYSLSCTALGVGTCTSIKNVNGTTITSINLPANGSAGVNVRYTASATPTSGLVRLSATNGIWSDVGAYAVTVTSPPAIVQVTPDSGAQYVGANTAAPYVFTVNNAGLASQSYTFTCSIVGAGSCGTVTPSSATLAAGASTQVTVNATSGASNGQVVLTAGGDATDAGRYYLTVLPGTPGTVSAVVAAPTPGPDLDRSTCLNVALGIAAAECGDLRLTHALPTTTLYGKPQTPTLIYTSASALPTPIVGATVSIPAGRLIPPTIEGVLRVNGVERARTTWNGYDWLNGRPRRIALTYAAGSDTSGVYAYELEVAAIYPSGRHATTFTGHLVLINRSTSPFGAGWWLAGLEQLTIGASTLRWTGGDGSTRRYALVANGVWVATNRIRPDTIIINGTNYERRIPGGSIVRFDQAGRHVATVSRLGRTTTFAYDGTGRLTTMGVPKPGGNVNYVFGYSGATLGTVTAPPNGAQSRIVTATVTSGRLTQLRDPDSTTIGFTYALGNGLITNRADRRGVKTNFTYSGSLVTGATVNGVAGTPYPTLRDQRLVGLNGVSVDTAVAYSNFDGPRTDVADTSAIWLNAAGAPAQLRSTIGGITQLTYGDARWPGLATRVVHPNGRITSAVYDARGLVVAQTDSSDFRHQMVGDMGITRYATTRYEYDPLWLTVTKVVPPEGDSTIFAYDPISGNRIWEQSTRGTASRVTYGYTADGRVSSIRQGGVRIDSLEYDALGNVAIRIDAMGAVSATLRDGIGRDTLTTSYIDAAGATRSTVRNRYSIMDRVTLHRTYGPLLPTATTDTVEVETFYSKEGAIDSLRRRSIPDLNAVGWMVTRYFHDSAGRKIKETDPAGVSDSLVYDPAGNLVAWRTRRQNWIYSTFDAANRLIGRTSPSVTYPKVIAEASNENAPFAYPTAADGSFTVPGDTAVFAYDVMGNQVRADNGAAQVRRGYTLAGRIFTDTLRTRTYAGLSNGGSFTAHQYVVEYEYDLNGRRTALTHPSQLAPLGPGGQPQDRQTYTYDPAGSLATVTDVQGGVYRFHYDAFGRVDTLWSPPGDVVEVFKYDSAGRLRQTLGTVSRFVGTDSGFASPTFRQELLQYDARGKILSARALRDTTENNYSALGALTHSVQVDRSLATRVRTTTDFALDAIGNWRWQDSDTDADNPPLVSYLYQAGTGRQTAMGVQNTPTFWLQWFDPAGNMFFRRQQERYDIFPPAGQPEDYITRTRNMYGADEHLLASQTARDLDGGLTSTVIDWQWRSFFEEYRYDALGRRVLKRSRGLYDCASTDYAWCSNGIERYVYDGESFLWEIRAPGGTSVTAATLENDTAQIPGDSRFFGRVGYTNGPSVDRPLGLFRIGYGKDYGDGHGFVDFGVLSMSLHYTWRRLPDLGIYSSGAAKRCQKYYTGPTLRTRCVEILWPARSAFLFKNKRDYGLAPSWMGGVALDGEDASGQMFRRNRFYDPETGRFTQEDPVRLGGGVNLYGYAGNDPIGLSDPFGLSYCPPDCYGWASLEWWWRTQVRGPVEANIIAPIHRRIDEARVDQITAGCVGQALCETLYRHYAAGGGDVRLSDAQFADITDVVFTGATMVGRPWQELRDGQTVWAASISFYGTRYALALGRATVYFNQEGRAIGMHDRYDFDPKPWGERSYLMELITRSVHAYGPNGTRPYNIDY